MRVSRTKFMLSGETQGLRAGIHESQTHPALRNRLPGRACGAGGLYRRSMWTADLGQAAGNASHANRHPKAAVVGADCSDMGTGIMPNTASAFPPGSKNGLEAAMASGAPAVLSVLRTVTGQEICASPPCSRVGCLRAPDVSKHLCYSRAMKTRSRGRPGRKCCRP